MATATFTSSDVNVKTEGLDFKNIRSIEMTDGWHDITDCEFVQFAVGIAHSPMSPTKLYPTLRYKNEYGRTTWTPLSNILSYSGETQGINRMTGSGSGVSGSSSRDR